MAPSRRSRARVQLLLVASALAIAGMPPPANAQLSPSHYASTCPNVEALVRGAVVRKLQQTGVRAAAGTLRLYFHDCFVRGCDASILLRSAAGAGNHELDNPLDSTISPDALDLIDKAKAAVDADPRCTNKVSCADIVALAARDAVLLTGGPFYAVELGRRDGRVSTKASVTHALPFAGFDLDQLTSLFAANGLSRTDMVALSGAHTIGVAHCKNFLRRLYDFPHPMSPAPPPMNVLLARQLRQTCPLRFSPAAFAALDTATPFRFDNAYFKNLQGSRGLLASDQVLFNDPRSRGAVDLFAANEGAFFQAFVAAITKLGRVGVKTGANGEIRRVCSAVN